MTAPTLNARTIVESALYQHVMAERDKYRGALVALAADHSNDGAGFCTGDHRASVVPFPCEIREFIDNTLGRTP